MKKLILLFLFLLFNSVVSASDSDLEISISGAVWCPYNCYPDKERPGLMLEIVKEALKETGIKVNYTELPWTRAVNLTREGKFDALIGASLEDAPDFKFPTESLVTAQNCFFTLKENNWSFNGIKSLENIIFSVGKDETLEEEFVAYIKKHPQKVLTLHGLDYFDRNISQVLNGKVSAFIGDRNVSQYMIGKKDKNKKFKLAGCSKKKIKIFLAFSPNFKDFENISKKLEAGIKKLKKSKKLDSIYNKYKKK